MSRSGFEQKDNRKTLKIWRWGGGEWDLFFCSKGDLIELDWACERRRYGVNCVDPVAGDDDFGKEAFHLLSVAMIVASSPLEILLIIVCQVDIDPDDEMLLHFEFPKVNGRRRRRHVTHPLFKHRNQRWTPTPN